MNYKIHKTEQPELKQINWTSARLTYQSSRTIEILETNEITQKEITFWYDCIQIYDFFQGIYLWVNLVHITYNAQALSMERNALMESVPVRMVLFSRRICVYMYQIKQWTIVQVDILNNLPLFCFLVFWGVILFCFCFLVFFSFLLLSLPELKALRTLYDHLSTICLYVTLSYFRFLLLNWPGNRRIKRSLPYASRDNSKTV